MTMASAQAVLSAGSDNISADLSRRPRLRVGLFVAGRLHPRCLVEAFSRIAASDYAEIVLVAVGRQDEPACSGLWRLYRRLDRWAFASSPDTSEAIDLPAHLASARLIEMPDHISGRPVLDFWLNTIARLGLDVAFTLGNIDDQAIAGVARYGAWRFALGGGKALSAGLEGFQEVAEGRGITTSSLRACLAGGSERILYESRSRTALFSASRNRDKLLRRIAQFPGRVLKALHQSQGRSLTACRTRVRRAPAAGQSTLAKLNLTSNLAGVAQRIVRRGLQKLLYVDQWFIAYRFDAAGGALANLPNFPNRPNPGGYSCLMPPKDRFWADPFPIQRDGRFFIFFEELIFADAKAHISVVELDRAGNCSEPQRVLERPYHLSYPCLIEEGGELFMVPETGQNGSVELYRCARFPDQWTLEKVLLRAPFCVDATFHRVGDKWWMFVNIGEDGSEVHDELHLYHADSLCGEWRAHSMNPVKSDVRSARPAGRLYQDNGKLYRPAQIGAPLYGSGITINRVLKLSPEEFVEEVAGCLLPPLDSDFLGVHTLNCAGELCVVDGFVRRSRLGNAPSATFEPEYLPAWSCP